MFTKTSCIITQSFLIFLRAHQLNRRPKSKQQDYLFNNICNLKPELWWVEFSSDRISQGRDISFFIYIGLLP